MTADPHPAFTLAPDRWHSIRVAWEDSDGDDVHLDVRLRVHRYAAHAAATTRRGALLAWRDDLLALHGTLQGEAVLDADGLLLALASGSGGHVAVRGRVVTPNPGWGSWGDADLRFTMPDVDGTDVASMVDWVDRALAASPPDREPWE